MTVEEFKVKYNLTVKNRFNREDFERDLYTELLIIASDHFTTQGEPKVAQYLSVVKDFRSLWDGIFEGSFLDKEATNKYWGYVFATMVTPWRETVIADFDLKLEEHHENKALNKLKKKWSGKHNDSNKAKRR